MVAGGAPLHDLNSDETNVGQIRIFEL
jgi:hypothetical protein